jgi:hypothetical protein
MTPDEEKNFTEKLIRLSYQCANELNISTKEVVSDVFIRWLINKIDNADKKNENNKHNIDISA